MPLETRARETGMSDVSEFDGAESQSDMDSIQFDDAGAFESGLDDDGATSSDFDGDGGDDDDDLMLRAHSPLTDSAHTH